MGIWENIKARFGGADEKNQAPRPVNAPAECHVRGVVVHVPGHFGTGIMLDSAYLLTAQHITRPASTYDVVSASGQVWGAARRLAVLPGADLALLCLHQPARPAISPLKIAGKLPQHEETAWFFSGRRGVVLGSMFAENRKKTPWQGLRNDSLSGDSGAGVLNERGELVTCISGSLKQKSATMTANSRGLHYTEEKINSTYGPDITLLHAFLAEHWPLYEHETPA